jgi:hypothetical protein
MLFFVELFSVVDWLQDGSGKPTVTKERGLATNSLKKS